MKISICLDYSSILKDYSDFNIIEKLLMIIKNSGFTHINISAEYTNFLNIADKEYFNRLKSLLDCYNLKIDWMHAPFLKTNIYTEDKELYSVSIAAIKKTIDSASEIKAGSVVVHPVNEQFSAEYNIPLYKNNIVNAYKILHDYGIDHGITVACENLIDQPVHEATAYLLDNIPELAFCFDTGHAQLSETWKFYLPKYFNRIRALHIHDNDGTFDQHLVPGSGTTDYNDFFKMAGRYNYDRVYGFEVVQKKTGFPGTPENIAEKIYSFLIGKRNIIEKNRSDLT